MSGCGRAVNVQLKLLNNAVTDLAAIGGQKPLVTKARKSVAGFKIRQGYPIGCKNNYAVSVCRIL